MTSITGTGTAPSPALTGGVLDAPSGPVAPDGDRETNQPAPALAGLIGQGAGNALMLGLSRPRNIGDIEAMFSEIAAKLRDTQVDTRALRDEAGLANRQSALRNAAFVITSMLNWGADIDRERENIAEQQALIAEATAQIEDLQAERGTLVSQRDGLNSQIAGLNGQIATRQAQIASNTAQINVLNAQIATADEPQRSQLIAQRDALQAQNQQLQAEITGLEATRNDLQAQVNEIEGQIAEIDAEIAELEDAIAEATESIAASEAEIEARLGMMASLVESALGFFNLMERDSSNAQARGLAVTQTLFDRFEGALARVLDQLIERDTDDERTDFTAENARLGLGNPTAQQGDGVAGRFGALTPAQASALGFAAAVLGSLAGVLQAMQGPAQQTPQAMQNEGLLRMRMAI